MKLKYFLLALAAGCGLFTAFNPASAQNWTLTSAPDQNGWFSIASSADGTKLVASGLDGNRGGIYTSTNAGATWTQRNAPTNFYLTSTASSADGTKLVEAGDGIYISTNSGATWTETMTPNFNSGAPSDNLWTFVASSADGTDLVASGGASFSASTNSGVSWTNASGPRPDYTFGFSVVSSADGTKWVAFGSGFDSDGGGIYASTNAGATWTLTSAPILAWTSMASSADGTKLVAVCNGGPGEWYNGSIYTSKDSGATWKQANAPGEYWLTVASSSDGTRLAAGTSSGGYTGVGIYTSTNSGATWIATAAPDVSWDSIASSADGTKLAATVGNGGIYTLDLTVPQVTTQPTNQTVLGGVTAALSAGVSCVAPLAYQWQFNGTNLLDATNAVLTLTNVALTDAGSYALLVTNSFGGGLSSNAVLTVIPAVVHTEPQPTNQTVLAGTSVSFTVSVLSEFQLKYQWEFHDAALPDATNATLTLTDVAPLDSGAYSVLITDPFGSIYSSNAVLTVIPLLIDTQPKSTASPVLAGTNVTFDVRASSTVPLFYQWLFNATNLPDATNATLEITDVTSLNSGSYSALISNSFGSVLSSNAMLPTVLPAFVKTLPASGLSASGATLNGLVTPGSQGSAVWFEWGVDTTYGNCTGTNTLAPSDHVLTFSSLLSGLSANIIYHCRMVAENVYGLAQGADQPFVVVPTVLNSNDGGPGSLRQAIQIACAIGAPDISFNVTGAIVLTNGALVITNNLAITGPGATNLSISGSYISSVFEISSNTIVSISGVTICNAYGGEGGGIYNQGQLSLSYCTLTNNLAGYGGNGAGANGGAGFGGYGSDPDNNGGPGGPGGDGGGVCNLNTFHAIGCAFSGNFAGVGGDGGNVMGGFETQYGFGGPGGNGGNGGGLYNSGTMALTNCTLCGNVGGRGGYGGDSFEGAGGFGGNGGNGGGIYNSGALELVACTLSANFAGDGGGGNNGDADGNGGDGGGIWNVGTNKSAKLLNTLVAANEVEPTDATGFGGFGPDLAGPFTSLGYNLVGQTNDATGIINDLHADLAGDSTIPLNPLLGPLACNDGPTPTMALLHGSPALDAGDDALLNPPYNLSTDQRGFPRKGGARVDIGAFAFQPTVSPPALIPLPTSAGFQLTFANTSGATFTVLRATNLSVPSSQWTVLGQALEITPGQFQFTDPPATNNPNQFYRVTSP